MFCLGVFIFLVCVPVIALLIYHILLLSLCLFLLYIVRSSKKSIMSSVYPNAEDRHISHISECLLCNRHHFFFINKQ